MAVDDIAIRAKKTLGLHICQFSNFLTENQYAIGKAI